LVAFNRDYEYQCYLEELETARATPRGSIVRSAIIYGILILAVVLAFLSRDGNAGQRFGPLACNTILTTSMKSVYPKGSLVASWAVKPGEPLQAGLDKGTDIVLVREDGVVIVHRIVEIMDNYEDSGQRGFRTQGVDNLTQDGWVTCEGNVIGRVTWHTPYLGGVLSYIAEHILWIAVGLAGVFALLILLKVLFRKEPVFYTPEQQEV